MESITASNRVASNGAIHGGGVYSEELALSSENSCLWLSDSTYSVEDVAHRLHLKAQRANGKEEWHGANPGGIGATKDGFILYDGGNAWDRSSGRCYNCTEVAALAGIAPAQYEPYRAWRAQVYGLNPPLSDRRGNEQTSTRVTTNHPVSRSPVDIAQRTSKSPTERGLRPETETTFEIIATDSGWQYPTYFPDGTPGRQRIKQRHYGEKNKYRYLGSGDVPIPLGYGLDKLRGATTVWLVGGEPDVWATYQAGLPAISTFGEGNGHTPLMKALKQLGVTAAHIALDNDEARHTGAIKAMQAGAAAGIQCTVRVLSGPGGFDVCDLYEQCGFDDEKFREAMENLPVADSQTLKQWGKAKSAAISIVQAGTAVADDAALSLPLINVPNWPAPLTAAAYHGLVGDIVSAIEPHTESDPAALLVTCLLFFGNVIGRQAHCVADGSEHYMNLFAVLAGNSSKGRKGTSTKRILDLFRPIDPNWIGVRAPSGLSSGEGLIYAVRDAVEKQEPIRQERKIVGYEPVVTDAGVTDKRLPVIEPEFAGVLRVANREGNTLSALLRQAWDSGTLQTLTKNTPLKATDAHISMLGHVTKDELLRYLNSTEAGNGFANRFLWVCVRRSKKLPEGGRLHEVNLEPLLKRLKAAIEFAAKAGELRRDEDARMLWNPMYAELTAEQPGLLGSVLARAEAQVMRLSCIYALLDCSTTVRPVHLLAAKALWDYTEASARFIFGDALGDPLADEILRFLREALPEGRTQSQLWKHLSGNGTAARLQSAFNTLVEAGLVRREKSKAEGAGRPAETWFAETVRQPTRPTAPAMTSLCDERNERNELNGAMTASHMAPSNSSVSSVSFVPPAPAGQLASPNDAPHGLDNGRADAAASIHGAALMDVGTVTVPQDSDYAPTTEPDEFDTEWEGEEV